MIPPVRADRAGPYSASPGGRALSSWTVPCGQHLVHPAWLANPTPGVACCPGTVRGYLAGWPAARGVRRVRQVGPDAAAIPFAISISKERPASGLALPPEPSIPDALRRLRTITRYRVGPQASSINLRGNILPQVAVVNIKKQPQVSGCGRVHYLL